MVLDTPTFPSNSGINSVDPSCAAPPAAAAPTIASHGYMHVYSRMTMTSGMMRKATSESKAMRSHSREVGKRNDFAPLRYDGSSRSNDRNDVHSTAALWTRVFTR